jgi:hypothetical protein
LSDSGICAEGNTAQEAKLPEPRKEIKELRLPKPGCARASLRANEMSFKFNKPILGTRIENSQFDVPLLRRSSQKGYFAKQGK